MAIPLRRPRHQSWLLIAAFVTLLAAAAAFAFYRSSVPGRSARLARLRQYWSDPEAHIEWAIQAGQRCQAAPFINPTSGFVGFLWGDSFRPGHTHQGLDIFGPSGPDGLGQTQVVAAYDGYLTRLPEWRSAVIIRHPQDPLQPDRQIWTFYTHMADPEGKSFIEGDFPAGTSEQFVRAGTLLGYQGNYSGNSDNPTGMHLHFSIVRDDGQGRFLNELEFRNTIDPSPYLGYEVNPDTIGEEIPGCLSGNDD